MKGDVDINMEDFAAHNEQKSVSAAVSSRSRGAIAKRVGSTMKKPIKGVDVEFKLVAVDANDIDTKTFVWGENERDQYLLDEYSLNDIIPSIKKDGIEVPAFGRQEGCLIVVADGSRRRKAAQLVGTTYYVWVGDLTDEQMEHLSAVGNQYQPTSAYERGKSYIKRIEREKISENRLSQLVGVDRAAIKRCIKAAGLPREFMRCLSSPNVISARKGAAMADAYLSLDGDARETLNGDIAQWLTNKKAGEPVSDEALIEKFLEKAAKSDQKLKASKRKISDKVSLAIKGTTAKFEIKEASEELIAEIEALIKQREV